MERVPPVALPASELPQELITDDVRRWEGLGASSFPGVRGGDAPRELVLGVEVSGVPGA